jgi:hypothetical protein
MRSTPIHFLISAPQLFTSVAGATTTVLRTTGTPCTRGGGASQGRRLDANGATGPTASVAGNRILHRRQCRFSSAARHQGRRNFRLPDPSNPSVAARHHLWPLPHERPDQRQCLEGLAQALVGGITRGPGRSCWNRAGCRSVASRALMRLAADEACAAHTSPWPGAPLLLHHRPSPASDCAAVVA